ncbi:MAG TPA: hypothetical protein VGW34_09535 [Allosphingosinicella sp.]|nr:hypothetical protein [Allosphingosinicella sp.]
MTARPLGFDFPLMSELSRRPPWQVGGDEQLRELDEEIAHRRDFYPRLAARGAMSIDEGARHIAILLAIRADVDGGADRAETWETKVRELRRELGLRRGAWPRKVAKPGDPLDEATARARMERLEAVHWRYWVRLEFCDDLCTTGFPPPHFVASDAQYGLIRARKWAAWEWERTALARGDPAARPDMADYFDWLHDSSDAEAVSLRDHYRFCAERLGFAPSEKEAA